MELTVDTDTTDSDESELPKYINLSTISSLANEQELLFAGNRAKLKITRIFQGDADGYSTEISAVSKTYRLLQNGSPKWSEAETGQMLMYCSTMNREYVACSMIFDFC